MRDHPGDPKILQNPQQQVLAMPCGLQLGLTWESFREHPDPEADFIHLYPESHFASDPLQDYRRGSES